MSEETKYEALVPIVYGPFAAPAGSIFTARSDGKAYSPLLLPNGTLTLLPVHATHLSNPALFREVNQQASILPDPVSDAIRSLREALSETQQQFASRVGCSVRALAGWETGSRPSRYYAMLLVVVAEGNGYMQKAGTLRSELGIRLPHPKEGEPA